MEIWNGCIMVLKPSPYLTIQIMVWAEEFIWGYHYDWENPFQWSNIRLNLTRDSKYSPSLPWVSNTTKEGKLEAGLWTYIDDIRRIT